MYVNSSTVQIWISGEYEGQAQCSVCKPVFTASTLAVECQRWMPNARMSHRCNCRTLSPTLFVRHSGRVYLQPDRW